MPTKTAIFSDVTKFDGTKMRYLHSHEYTQQAGRAGDAVTIKLVMLFTYAICLKSLI